MLKWFIGGTDRCDIANVIERNGSAGYEPRFLERTTE
jgi:hypothetical protein